MIYKILFLHLVVLSFNFSFAETNCSLPEGRIIKIGCTKKCGNTYRDALATSAKKLGYKIKVTTIGNTQASNLKKLDAILSPGGHDINPSNKRYQKKLRAVGNDSSIIKMVKLHKKFGNRGKQKPKHDRRDNKELDILDNYMNDKSFEDTPYLGVCYGMQIMAAHQGVPLYVHIPKSPEVSERRTKKNGVQDKISISSSGEFSDYLSQRNKASFPGFKNHHQAVNLPLVKRHKNFELLATSNKGKIPEIIQMKNRPALGIQFHAERTKGNSNAKLAPYNWFLTKACIKITQPENKSGTVIKPEAKEEPSET